jgi:hypothetical protein
MTSDAADADKAMIAELRTAYNRAIQTRDLDRIESFLLPAYVVLPGSVGTPKSRDETRAIFAKAFADPAFVEYVRETRVVVVSSGRQRAAEVGVWHGLWKAPAPKRLSGIYQAVWLPERGSWRLLNESFVTIED